MIPVIVDEFEKVVDEVRALSGGVVPYYLYGHRKEIANKLLAKDKNKMYTYQRYPVIALRMDFSEDKSDGLIKLNLNIGILMFTDMNYDAEKRYTNVIKPVLYPLYEKFLEALDSTGLFTWPGDLGVPQHTKIDRPYWGVEESEGNVRNIFNDPIDAIEILNLRINSANLVC